MRIKFCVRMKIHIRLNFIVQLLKFFLIFRCDKNNRIIFVRKTSEIIKINNKRSCFKSISENLSTNSSSLFSSKEKGLINVICGKFLNDFTELNRSAKSLLTALAFFVICLLGTTAMKYKLINLIYNISSQNQNY